jgi:hypothetical protein
MLNIVIKLGYIIGGALYTLPTILPIVIIHLNSKGYLKWWQCNQGGKYLYVYKTMGIIVACIGLGNFIRICYSVICE